MRLLGVDLGERRIGIALGEAEFGIAHPRSPLAATGALKRDAEAISALARLEGAEAVVLGLALEPSGEEGRMARASRLLAGHLSALGHTVHLVDESLTSVESEAFLRDHGLKASQRRKMVDGEAARRILERYMQRSDGEATR